MGQWQISLHCYVGDSEDDGGIHRKLRKGWRH